MNKSVNVKIFSLIVFILSSLAFGEVIVFQLYAGCPGCLPCSVSGNTLSCNCFSASVSVSGSSANYNRSGYNYSMPLESDSSTLSTCWMESHYSLQYSGDCYAIACDFVSIINSSSSNSSSSSEESSSSSSETNEECYYDYSEAAAVYDAKIEQCIREWNIPNFKLNADENCVSGECLLRSSSSEEASVACGENKRGGDAVYAASDCFSEGLDNMEPGKCYSLNPDRGTQYGWISNDAQDSWWWIEVSCDGSKPIESITSNGCKNNKRGENAVYTASDCFSEGLDNMEPGKCYSLNPDRGTQYGWINNNAQDSWWWREVPCGEESIDNECPVNSFLQKNSMLEKNFEDSSEYISHEIWENKTQLFYDALGRKTQKHPETRRYLFLPKRDKKAVNNAYIDSWNANVEFNLVLRDNLNEDRCGEIGYDYGYIKPDGEKSGGITCHYVDAQTEYPRDNIKKCSDGSGRLDVNFDFIITPELTRNSIHYVRKGYKYPGSDYIVSEEDEFAIMWHEKGHQKYNECIVFEVETIHYSGCYCQTDLENIMRQEKYRIIQKYIDIIKNYENLFHAKYGNEGYSTSYECPN